MDGASSVIPEYSEIGSTSSSESQAQAQHLETQLTNMLRKVDPEITELNEKCIYRVPEKFRRVNPKAYTPRVVSIGPFHNPRYSNGGDNLKLMEERKLKYLEKFLNRNKHLSMKGLFLRLIEKEKQIRGYYAEPVSYSSDDFLTMILVDACFIIEHFLRYYTGLTLTERDTLSEPCLLSDIYHDMILLENQLPFFVLEDIFNSAHPGMIVEFPYKDVKGINDDYAGPISDVESLSFIAITFHYFRKYNHYIIEPAHIDRPYHFIDLLRIFWLPIPIPPESLKSGFMDKLIPSASQLSEVGLIFKASLTPGLFDIKYDHHMGVMEIPCILINHKKETELRNILALEQCRYILSPNMTQYLFILDCLVNTDKDASILIDNKIFINWLGDANAVAKMFNSLCSNVVLPFISEECFSLCDNLVKFYENPRNKYKAIFYHEYFNTPWKKASTSAAVLLLLLTLIQTICSVMVMIQLITLKLLSSEEDHGNHSSCILGNIKEMEGQQICSQSQAQYLETELSKMLPIVVLQMSEVNEQCIYKVPQKFREGNPKAYTPQVVSIGPFHKPRDSNGENNTLVRMEELKLEYLRRFLNRNKQLSMKDLFQRLIEKEKRIRSCYGEPIKQ
ncbi:UPF0481 protein [Glycine soja]